MDEGARPQTRTNAALITGGAGGLGRAVARHLDAAGCHVVLLGRDPDSLAEAAAACAGFWRPPALRVADVTDRGSVEAAVAWTAEHVGPPLVLVNAAGIAQSAALLPPNDDLWHRTLAVNATGAWIASTACLPHMQAAGHGFICHVASTAALEGFRYTAAYVASKHAVLGLTRAMAADLAGRGVRVCAVCPGFLDTPMTDRTVANMMAQTGMAEAEARAALAGMNASGHLIEPDDVAEAIARLLADEGAGGKIERLD